MKLAIAVLILICAIPAGAHTVAIVENSEFFVATNGSDSWSGTLAAPNKARTDGPFATLARARDAVRALKDADAEAVVEIRKGTYFLPETLVFGPQDTHHVTFTAYKGEKVTISGGRPIAGFRPAEVNGKKMMAAEIPEVKAGKWYFTQLFVNDRRRSRSRLPKEGFYNVADVLGVDKKNGSWAPGTDNFIYREGDIKASWKNPADIDIVALNFWIESRMQIKSVDEKIHQVNLNKPSVTRLWGEWSAGGARYFVENVFEALEKGQWYLDRPTGTLYYYPFTGEDASKLTFVAPRLEQLVVVGDGLKEGQRLSGVSFKNLKFAHTEPVHPKTAAGYPQAAFGVPGAVQFLCATDSSITNCEISGIGTYAVEVGPGGGKSPWGKPVTIEGRDACCERISIERNRIVDMGAGGVKVQPDSSDTTIADNEIGDGGKIFMSAVGVWIGNTPNNIVIHNNIHDFNYTGVSVGWIWGYGESRAKNNKIEFNHIHHVGRSMLSDLGGIYTLGTQPGTVLRNNLIHDSACAGYGGWGIYTDEGSTHILIENNVVYNTQTAGFHQHYGKENTLRNNIFALGTDQQLQRSRVEEHTSFFFDHNIVYYEKGALLGSNWKDDHFVMDSNVYWNAAGRPVDFAGASFEDWKKRGHDQHSVIADPLFVDAKKHDFRLKPESPALKMGFKQIDVSTVGPRVPIGPGR